MSEIDLVCRSVPPVAAVSVYVPLGCTVALFVSGGWCVVSAYAEGLQASAWLLGRAFCGMFVDDPAYPVCGAFAASEDAVVESLSRGGFRVSVLSPLNGGV